MITSAMNLAKIGGLLVLETPVRPRWTLSLGPSSIAFPRIIKQTGEADVFVHDSASNYDTQMTGYRITLSNMPAGGVLISNTLNSDAFIETAEAVKCRWAVIEQSKKYPLGILQTL